MSGRGVKILEVERGSAAAEIGLAPGDLILAVDGHEIADELALKFYLSEEIVRLQIRHPDGAEARLQADLSNRTSLGIKVEEFRTRTCNNDCLFCFIDQLPPGVRQNLKVKDDDYRLSFLHGNYITLTNLAQRELDRIVEQRLSPLYVSVHATEPELRTRMLGRRKVDDLEQKMKKLIQGGIRIHAQIVLMPEINDGEHLQKTVFDLYDYYPGVESIAIVPLGISDHGSHRERFTPVTPAYSLQVIAQVSPWQTQFRAETGRTFAYLADEFYIQGGADLPQTEFYDDFAQIEDGIGMVRDFLDEFDEEMKRRRRDRPSLQGTLVTGRLFSGFLQDCAERFNRKFETRLQVCQAENQFMGKNITVAGLLSGKDIVSALNGREIGNFVIIPNEAVSRLDGILVDDLSPADISRIIGKPVYPSGRTMRDFFRLLFLECGNLPPVTSSGRIKAP
jgi:putative radical SAM enzyme (TIGR03279 family)